MKPLEGIRVVELEGLAPAPFCGRILADFGAEVTLVKRPGPDPYDISLTPLHEGKRQLTIDLKKPKGKDMLLFLTLDSDVLIDPYRPGVLDKLGLTAAELRKNNPRLIIARITGYGQTGPFSKKAGHDINFLALSGVLSRFKGEGKKPVPPLNILGDFAAGGLLAAFAIVLALFQGQGMYRGKDIDLSITEGVTYLATDLFGRYFDRLFTKPIEYQRLDGRAPYYNIYETKDGKFMAVGAIEEKFYIEFLKGLGIDPAEFPPKEDERSWPSMKKKIQERFKEKTREEWIKIFEELDACVTPVLELEEAVEFELHRARGQFQRTTNWLRPTPAPRIS